jgi:hypothetical protein
MAAAVKLNSNERAVLRVLAGVPDGYYKPFAPIARTAGIERNVVRRACRSLKRKGLTEFLAGLWTEDGEPAGAGYAATPAGRELIGDDTLQEFIE